MDSLRELELELKGEIKAVETFLSSKDLSHTRTYKKAEEELPFLKHTLKRVTDKREKWKKNL